MRIRTLCRATSLMVCLAACSSLLHAQENTRGRKYTPPPPVAHIVVTVTKAGNNKPIESASVIFHTIRNGKDQGNLEMKTNEEGQAVLDVVPIGDTVRLQIIKSGFQTYGEDYEIGTNSKDIAVKMKLPGQQYSSYAKPDNAAKQANTPKP